jgi:PAS domain S-box-containing protein
MESGPRPVRIARSFAAGPAAAVFLTSLVAVIYLLGGPYASISEPAWSISLVLAALALAVALAVALGVSRLRRERHEELLSRQLAAERERTALAERVAHLMRGANDAIMLTDKNFRIIEANDRAVEAYGYTLAELQQKNMVELRAPEHRASFPQVAARLTAEGRAFLETVHQRKDGTTFPVELSIRLAEIGGAPYTLGIVRDTTERKEAEARQRLALGALELLNGAGNVSSLSGELLRLIKNSTGFDAVGLRLRQGDDFPYYEQSGFSDAFVQAENFLCARSEDGLIMRDAAGQPVLECTCGVVLSGQADPSMPCFTKGGSFWTNASSELLELAPEDDPRTKPRNRCIHAGYQSVALVPVRSGDEIIGLLQLNDRRTGRFTPGLVRFFEGLGASIGIALKHKQAEEAVAESERRYRQIVELSPEAIAVHCEGKIVFVNSAAVRLAGAKGPDELLGRSAFDFVHPDDRAQALQRVRISLDTGTPAPLIEQRFVRLDGTVMEAEIRSQLMSYQNKQAIQVLIRDVSERKRAEQALRAAAQEWQTTFDSVNDAVWLLDKDQRVVRGNQTTRRIFQHAPSALIGRQCWEIVHGTSEPIAGCPFVRMRKSLRRETMELQRDDQWFEVAVDPIADEAGQLTGAVHIVSDITERKRAEQALRQSEDRYRDLVEHSQELMCTHDLEGRILSANPWSSRVLGYQLDTILQMNIRDFLVPEVRGQVDTYLAEIKKHGAAKGLLLVQTAAGERRIWEYNNTLRTEGVAAAIVRGTARDITERKRAEDAIRDRERALKEAQRVAHVGSWDRSLETGVLTWSEELCRIYGVDPKLPIPSFEDLAQFYTPESWARLRPAVEKALQTGAPFELDVQIVRTDGTVIWVATHCEVVRDATGQIVGTHGTVLDITERKRAEAEQAALLEIAKDIAGVVHLNEILNRVHQRVATLLPCDRITTYYWDAASNTYRALAWRGVPYQLDHDTMALEFHSGQPVTDRLLAGETVLINDIADQRLVPVEIFTHFGLTAALVVPLVVRGRSMGAMAALNAESGCRFDPHQVRLFEGIAQQVGVAIEAADLYSAKEEEAAIAGAFGRVGQEIISSLSSPALLDRLCQLTAEVLGCDSSLTWLWEAPREAFVPVAVYGASPEEWETVSLIRLGRSALAAQLEAMERDGILNAKVADLPDSEVKAWVSAYGVTAGLMVPLRRGGELVGFHVAYYRGREVVLGKRHERIARGLGQLASLALENVRLIEQLERANRLKSDFVATMSHELRTPLNIIMGYNDLLLDGGFGPMSDEQVDTLQRIDKSAEQLLELITATLDLSRLDTGQVQLDVQAIALPDLVKELDGGISGLRENPNVKFAWDVAPELPELRSDPAKLKVVLKNLISNAIKFTHAGSIVVRLRGRDGGAEITVADTGVGIASEMLPVIFEPFRQGEPVMTRQHGGVGLGLYIVRRVLDILGGTIEVESTVGQGSTFRVWVPSRMAA